MHFFRRADANTTKKIVRFLLPARDTHVKPSQTFISSPHSATRTQTFILSSHSAPRSHSPYTEPHIPPNATRSETLRFAENTITHGETPLAPGNAHTVDRPQPHSPSLAPARSESNTNTNSEQICRIHITDNISHHRFLIDTGAEISVIPPNTKERLNPSPSRKLSAANGTQIATYGQKTLSLDLGLERKFSWTFVVADVSTPIIGADFLEFYDLLADAKRKRLIDNSTKLEIQSTKSQNKNTISTICINKQFASIVERYKDITKLNTKHKTTKTVM